MACVQLVFTDRKAWRNARPLFSLASFQCAFILVDVVYASSREWEKSSANVKINNGFSSLRLKEAPDCMMPFFRPENQREFVMRESKQNVYEAAPYHGTNISSRI